MHLDYQRLLRRLQSDLLKFAALIGAFCLVWYDIASPVLAISAFLLGGVFAEMNRRVYAGRLARAGKEFASFAPGGAGFRDAALALVLSAAANVLLPAAVGACLGAVLARA